MRVFSPYTPHRTAASPWCAPLVALSLLALVASGCGDDGGGGGTASNNAGTNNGTNNTTTTPNNSVDLSQAPALAESGALTFDVVVPASAGPGLEQAATDMLGAAAQITGAPTKAPVKGAVADATGPVVVEAVVDTGASASLGEQGYTIVLGSSDGRSGLTITARTEAGAMYGLYDVIGQMGVRYFHPEESFYPSNAGATLPWGFDGAEDVPAFDRRGLHEHTQHPIIMSDYYLRPGDANFRSGVSKYLLWMARNRQNAVSFHSLNTLDMDAWIPYIKGINEEADGLHVDVGFVVSFADQQQHNFKLIEDLGADDAGEQAQIVASLDRFMEAGFDFVTFQIGTSEFTKPEPGSVLRWLNGAVGHLKANYPGVKPYAWIHITCELFADDGGLFYHQPFEADPELGAWVHTTMYYTLTDPAPVYDCEDFTHQLDAFELGDGQRELVFFPETAWWLGFDNNLPLTMPITGISRERDIQLVLDEYDTTGHITFTTGREWGYWQYDHYVHQSTWDRGLTWDDYLTWIEALYGSEGSKVAEALRQWTDLQEQHFYTDNPLIYFYLAGELPQDEVGELAGVLARRPKIAFSRVYRYSDAEFDAWKTRDYDMLVSMREAYGAIFDTLPTTLAEGTEQQKRLYDETWRVLKIYMLRLDHAIALYGGVIDLRNLDRTAAETKLASAQAISQEVIGLVAATEGEIYRYPLELLSQPKPESKTSYPFGYLEETSTGFFWTRRDDQFGALIERVFAEQVETWSEEPSALFSTEKDQINLTDPDNPLAGTVLAGFFPRFLWGQLADQPTLTLALAADHNDNRLPDEGSELDLTAEVQPDGSWAATAPAWELDVFSSTGEQLGTLDLVSPSFTASGVVVGDDGIVTALGTMTMQTSIRSAQLIELVRSVAGIDQEGIENLLKDVFLIPAEEPLPEELSVTFELGTAPMASE